MKKKISIMFLVVALICINVIPVMALADAPSTERQFWDMDIRSYQRNSDLTTRNK